MSRLASSPRASSRRRKKICCCSNMRPGSPHRWRTRRPPRSHDPRRQRRPGFLSSHCERCPGSAPDLDERAVGSSRPEVDIRPVYSTQNPTTARSTRSAGRSRARCTPRGPSEDGRGSVPAAAPVDELAPPVAPSLHGRGHGAFPDQLPLEHEAAGRGRGVDLARPLAGEHPQAHAAGRGPLTSPTIAPLSGQGESVGIVASHPAVGPPRGTGSSRLRSSVLRIPGRTAFAPKVVPFRPPG